MVCFLMILMMMIFIKLVYVIVNLSIFEPEKRIGSSFNSSCSRIKQNNLPIAPTTTSAHSIPLWRAPGEHLLVALTQAMEAIK